MHTFYKSFFARLDTNRLKIFINLETLTLWHQDIFLSTTGKKERKGEM